MGPPPWWCITIPRFDYSRPENCCARGMAGKMNLMRADRIGYVAGGIALIVWALRRPGVARAGAAGIGGWLLYPAHTRRHPMVKPPRIPVNPAPPQAHLARTIR